jgi:betaine-aldehyde dehydrogenase
VAHARAVTTGTVWINTYKQFSISHALRRRKGLRHRTGKGQGGIRAYMAQKSVYVDLTGNPHPWARWPEGGA